MIIYINLNNMYFQQFMELEEIMNISQHKHPLLYARAFISEWPAPLGADYELTHVRSYFGAQFFDSPAQYL